MSEVDVYQSFTNVIISYLNFIIFILKVVIIVCLTNVIIFVNVITGLVKLSFFFLFILLGGPPQLEAFSRTAAQR